VLKSVNHNVGLYGHWPKGIKPNGNTLYDFDTGARLYKSCKIAISDSQWPKAAGFVSNRLFQALAAGAFLMQQEFDGMEKLLGLKPDIHLVVWKDLNDLIEKVAYWLHRPNERNRIAKQGQEYILQKHSFDVRVNELLERLQIV
jgi:spore maturation protein CgeB